AERCLDGVATAERALPQLLLRRDDRPALEAAEVPRLERLDVVGGAAAVLALGDARRPRLDGEEFRPETSEEGDGAGREHDADERHGDAHAPVAQPPASAAGAAVVRRIVGRSRHDLPIRSGWQLFAF